MQAYGLPTGSNMIVFDGAPINETYEGWDMPRTPDLDTLLMAMARGMECPMEATVCLTEHLMERHTEAMEFSRAIFLWEC